MRFLKIKDVIYKEDERESNRIRNNRGEIIGHKQSKCTVRFIFEDIINGEEFCWVKKNKDIAEAIRLIAINEDKKYPSGLGRNLMFNSYYYPIWEKYLLKNNYIPNIRDIKFSISQTKKSNPNIEKFIKKVIEENENKN